MVCLQIRGANGAGKTTAVKQFCERHKMAMEEIDVQGVPTFITTNGDRSIVVLGRYDKKIGGCDMFRNKTHVFNTLKYVAERIRPKTIIYEGLLYGLTFKFSREVADYIGRQGYTYRALLFDIDFDTALDRIYKRNGGKEINLQSLLSKIERAYISSVQLEESGCELRVQDTRNADISRMYQYIEDALA